MMRRRWTGSPCRARTGRGRAFRHPAAGRPRRPRHQDRAAGRGRFRARLRHHRARHRQPFRLAEPVEGIADARSEAARGARRARRGCSRAPTSSCRTSRPAPPIGSASAPKTLRARHTRGSSSAISAATDRPARTPTKKAYDLLVQSEAGLLSITGTPDTPSKVGLSIADIAGGMYAYSGILTALLQRQQTGQGTVARSLAVRGARRVDGLRDVLHDGRDAARPDGREPRDDRPVRAVSRRATARSSSAFRTTASGPRSATDVLDRPDLAEDARFQSNQLRVAAPRGDGCRNRSGRSAALDRRRLLARLDAAQIANARLNTVEQFIAHPQLAGRDAWRQVDSPAGPIPALVPPVRMEGVEPVMDPIPARRRALGRDSGRAGLRRGRHRALAAGTRDLAPQADLRDLVSWHARYHVA